MSRIRANQITNQAADGAPTVQHGLIIAGVSTFTGSVSIGGTLTYEDVTNIDSVGIVTARGGIHIDDSIIHIGDTNTKIRFPAADTITAETGGSERLRITSDGKVGINQTGPTEDLEVKGDQTATIYINAGQHDASTANEATLKLGYNQSHGNDSIGYVKLLELGGNSYDGALTFGVPYNNSGTPATREALRIDSAGRIIRGHTGTYAVSGHYPALQLTGTTFNDATLGIINNANDSTGAYIQLSKQRSGSPTGATIVQDDDLVGQIGWTAGDGTDLTSRIAEIKGIVDGTPGSNDTPGRLSFWTTADGAQSTTERLRITSGGAVMINTTNSSSRTLNLNGTFGILSTNQSGVLDMSVTDAGDASIGPYVAGGSTLILKTNASGSGVAERLRITSSGKVGINSTSPQQALDVKGSINGGSVNQPFLRFHDSAGRQRNTKHYFKCIKGGTTTFDILTVDLNQNFHQALIILYYGARIQGVADTVTYPVHKIIGVNRFNGGSIQFTSHTVVQNSNVSTHANIDAVATSSTNYRIRLTYSGTAGGSSFCCGSVEIIGVGSGDDGCFYSLAHAHGLVA